MVSPGHEMLKCPGDVWMTREYFTELDGVSRSKTEETVVEGEGGVVKGDHFLVVIWTETKMKVIKNEDFCFKGWFWSPWKFDLFIFLVLQQKGS